MTRASDLIEKFHSIYEEDAPVLTPAGDEAIKRVDTFAKEQLRELNPALKWAWAGRQPSAPQRKSDNLEWTLTVNSESHGIELVDAAEKWADDVLKPAVDAEFGEGDLTVTIKAERNEFPADDEDKDKAGITFVKVELRLADMVAAGLLEGGVEEEQDA